MSVGPGTARVNPKNQAAERRANPGSGSREKNQGQSIKAAAEEVRSPMRERPAYFTSHFTSIDFEVALGSTCKGRASAPSLK